MNDSGSPAYQRGRQTSRLASGLAKEAAMLSPGGIRPHRRRIHATERAVADCAAWAHEGSKRHPTNEKMVPQGTPFSFVGVSFN